MERKRAAMAEMKAQALPPDLLRAAAEQRGNHARRISGQQGDPLRRGLPARPAPGADRRCERRVRRARAAGLATVYEASGRHGLVDLALEQVIPGSRACGPARTVRCGTGRQPDGARGYGPRAARRRARADDAGAGAGGAVGELLATQAKARGVAALLVDAAVRDVEELRELGLPVWARWVRVRGADKDVAWRARRAGGGRRRRDPTRATPSCSTRTALSSVGARVSRRCSRRRTRARSKERAKRAKLAGGRSSPTTSTGCARSSRSAGVSPSGSATSRTSGTPSCSRPSPRRACASSRRCSGCRWRHATGSPSSCAAGATTSATASSSPSRRRPGSGTWRCARGAPRRSSGAWPRSSGRARHAAGPTATSGTARPTASPTRTAT